MAPWLSQTHSLQAKYFMKQADPISGNEYPVYPEQQGEEDQKMNPYSPV